jgi:hypothetical protein
MPSVLPSLIIVVNTVAMKMVGTVAVLEVIGKQVNN